MSREEPQSLEIKEKSKARNQIATPRICIRGGFSVRRASSLLSWPRVFGGYTRPTLVLVGVLSVAVLGLTACGVSVPEVTDGGQKEELSEFDTPDETIPDASASGLDGSSLPSCDVVERQVGAGLETLEFAIEDAHIAEHAMDSTHMTCMWVTEMYEDLRGADANTLMEAVHTGVVTMSINVSPQPLAAEDAAASGMFFHDLRAERVGGFVFAPEDTDLSDPLGMMGMTVSVDNIDVTWGGGTYFDGQGDQIAEMFNKDWGIDAAVTVHRLIWD